MALGIHIELDFTEPGYIAEPYWPEREKVIEIQKKSGMNRTRSDRARQNALESYLKANQINQEQYDELVRLADRPFYTVDATHTKDHYNGHRPEEIVLSAHQIYGCLAQGSALCPSSMRISTAANIRTVLKVSEFYTGKDTADGIWERFVVVTGAGAKLSNQRALRSSPFIKNFTARGELSLINPEMERSAKNFIEWCGREVGLGASRKMGWGRFTISDWRS